MRYPRLERGTPWLKVRCSADWANSAFGLCDRYVSATVIYNTDSWTKSQAKIWKFFRFFKDFLSCNVFRVPSICFITKKEGRIPFSVFRHVHIAGREYFSACRDWNEQMRALSCSTGRSPEYKRQCKQMYISRGCQKNDSRPAVCYQSYKKPAQPMAMPE